VLIRFQIDIHPGCASNTAKTQPLLRVFCSTHHRQLPQSEFIHKNQVDAITNEQKKEKHKLHISHPNPLPKTSHKMFVWIHQWCNYVPKNNRERVSFSINKKTLTTDNKTIRVSIRES
jgi:hypothetical protein